MKTILATVISTACIFIVLAFVCQGEYPSDNGRTLFKKHCEVCHPDGGNIVNKAKTLHKKDLEANGIKKPEDIVRLLRKPGPGMLKFDASTIPDKDAKELAIYVMKTFK